MKKCEGCKKIFGRDAAASCIILDTFQFQQNEAEVIGEFPDWLRNDVKEKNNEIKYHIKKCDSCLMWRTIKNTMSYEC